MELYEKLKQLNLIKDYKDYSELVWLRSIKLNNKIIDNPSVKIDENKNYHIKIGVLEISI